MCFSKNHLKCFFKNRSKSILGVLSYRPLIFFYNKEKEPQFSYLTLLRLKVGNESKLCCMLLKEPQGQLPKHGLGLKYLIKGWRDTRLSVKTREMPIRNSHRLLNLIEMLERFFSTKQERYPHGHSDPLITLLSGPPSCGKTSLLFQFAYNCALESQFNNGGTVVFLCNRRKVESKPPFLSQGIDSSSDIFKSIQMKYIDDDEGIKKYFAAFHLHDTYPMAVVVDDFGDFFDERSCQERYANPRGRDLAMIWTLALCRSAIMLPKNLKGHCQLLISDTHHGNSPRLLFIYKRWISSIFTIEGDYSGSFLLKNNKYYGSHAAESTKIAKYSVALQFLILEQIIEDER